MCLKTVRLSKNEDPVGRVKAWHNLSVYIFNELLSNSLVSLELSDGACLTTCMDDKAFTHTLRMHDFYVHVRVREITYGELNIHAAICLTDCSSVDVVSLCPVGSKKLRHESCVAALDFWFERLTSKHIQSVGGFACRRDYLNQFIDMQVDSSGYKKFGPFFM